jgi:hypothetical protein
MHKIVRLEGLVRRVWSGNKRQIQIGERMPILQRFLRCKTGKKHKKSNSSQSKKPANIFS